MRFINSISELGYYNHTAQTPCYCEYLINPDDLMLQALIVGGATGLVASIKVYSADGLTELEDATSYFSIYYFQQGGIHYFTLRLNKFSPAMCANKCWILLVQIQNGSFYVFSKFTDRYCLADCCVLPLGITVEQDDNDVLTPPAVPATTNNCGDTYITFEAVFTCYNLETGEYYGIPTGVTQGTPFPYKKKLNVIARIVERPREIRRQISYNCTLQRSESFIPYLFEQLEEPLFPAWKMREVESMFHADHLYINGTEFQYAGGSIFTQPFDCWELFKLQATLQTCTIRQTFGCTPACSSTGVYVFLVPEGYNDTDTAFNDGRLPIATTYEGLLDWYTTRPGVISVVDTSGDYANTAHSFEVTTEIAPPPFYYSDLFPRNLVYGTLNPEAPVVQCSFTLGTPVILEDSCLTMLGIPIIEDMPETSAAINSVGDWIVNPVGSIVRLSGGVGMLSIDTENSILEDVEGDPAGWLSYTIGDQIADLSNTFDVPDGYTCEVVVWNSQAYTDFTQVGNTVTMDSVTFTPDGAEVLIGYTVPGDTIIGGQIIGKITANGAPVSPQVVTIDADRYIIINTDGTIAYYGTFYPDPTQAQIILTEIYYSIV